MQIMVAACADHPSNAAARLHVSTFPLISPAASGTVPHHGQARDTSPWRGGPHLGRECSRHYLKIFPYRLRYR